MSETSEVTRAVYKEQIGLLYDALPLSLFVTMFNAGILVLVQWPVLPMAQLIAWLAAMSLVLSGRALLLVGYRRRQDDNMLERWESLFTIAAVATATVWASAILFLFPSEIEYQVFLAFVIAGMSAGAVTTLSYLRRPVLIYLSILLLPLAIRFFIFAETIQIAMGIMVVAFMIVLVSTSGRIFRNTQQNIAMRFEATHMQKVLRDTESKYHHIFESVPLGIAHYNMTGQILDHNTEYEMMVGMDKQSVGQWNLVKDSHDVVFSDAVMASLDKGSARYEGNVSAIGGRDKKDIRVHLAAIKDHVNDTHEGVAIVQDISEDKRLEKAKNEFVSSVNHELRTPLTSILAVLGLIKAEKLGTVADDMRKMLEIAESNSQRLLSLINDLLDMGRIESGELGIDMQAHKVLPILQSSIESMYPYAQQYEVTLQLQNELDGQCIRVDEIRYSQVLSNLLSNAIKFSPKGSVVEVYAEETNGEIRVAVRDAGPGIPEAFQKRMYKRFTQFDASDTKSTSGSGLGLSIAYELVNLMGGQLSYEGGEGKGALFYVDFPKVEC